MELLLQLQQIPGPSGDEGAVADFVETRCRAISGAEVRRWGDLLVVTRGRPRVAVFAHLDTTGFTLGYERKLIRIGNPYVKGGEQLREAGGSGTGTLELRQKKGAAAEWRLSGSCGVPGSRWVYADPLEVRKNRVSGPYLDNRAGVWSALRTLERCADVAVVFTTGEEHSGKGATLGARLVYEDLGITRALISDITWHTDSVRWGKGPAISYRDRSIPRQRFLQEVLRLAEASGLPFQREVESDGGSDGSYIERGPYPIDWVFVGAPEKRCHTPREACRISDLHGMVDLYAYLVPALSAVDDAP